MPTRSDTIFPISVLILEMEEMGESTTGNVSKKVNVDHKCLNDHENTSPIKLNRGHEKSFYSLVISQETFRDSHLGIKWEIFPLMGKNWDKKLLLGENFGFLLGKIVNFLFASQYWEYDVNVFPSYTQSWEQYGKRSQFIPNIVNHGVTFPQVIPRIVINMGTFIQVIPRTVNNMDKFPKLFPALGMI